MREKERVGGVVKFKKERRLWEIASLEAFHTQKACRLLSYHLQTEDKTGKSKMVKREKFLFKVLVERNH